MLRMALPGVVSAADSEFLRGAGVAIVTLLVLVIALGTVGFVMLFRRRGDAGIRDSSPDGLGAIGTQAGVLLVQLDDKLRASDDELGFAIAQFGADAAKPFANALADARAKVAEAFRLKQKLDDAFPDSDQDARQWTLQIVALCQQAQSQLEAQEATFGDRRRSEANAGATLDDLGKRIAATSARVDSARATIAALEKKYQKQTFAAVTDNPAQAERQLADARKAADAAAPRISTSGVSDVAATLQESGQAAHRADQLLDAVDQTAKQLADADAALTTLTAKTDADLTEARKERDQAPDADTGQAIIEAIALVEKQLAAARETSGPADPVASLGSLGDAVSQLDTALASARNQAQRLEHARTALTGALITAKSQIAEVQAYIGSNGGGVEARTRLAEAERQLMLAQATADPVEALDTARSSVTYSRDADALARYSGMG
ncbi:MAG: hypothetical protein ABJB03_09185 [Rhodoglobus sp.]